MSRVLIALAAVAATAYSVPLKMTGELVHRFGRSPDAKIEISLTEIAEIDGVETATQTIQEGVRIDVSFRLKQPPVCSDADKLADPSRGCYVRVLLENTRPDEVALSRCYVEWSDLDGAEAWKEPKVIEITTVEDFVDDGEKDIFIKPSVETNVEYYGASTGSTVLPEIKIQTPDKGTAECSSTTDPNYRQWDGDSFIINSAGTFSLWKASHRDYEVQSRVNGEGFNCGVALREGCDRVVFDQCTGSFRMNKYFNPAGDPSEQPIISREGGSTWVVTSQKTGAQTKVTQRVKITRSGRQVCGWSGCRTVYHTIRKDWLDVYMKAPGSDYGWHDSATAQQTVPKVTGACGRWTANRGDDQIGKSGSQASSKAAFIDSWKVSGRSLFEETPSACETPGVPPVKIEAKECSATPRRVQKPLISVFDIEDITDMLKNTLEQDEDEDEVVYAFDVEQLLPIERTDYFIETQRAFCEQAMTGSKFAIECAATEVRKINQQANDQEGANGVSYAKETIDLEPFVRACLNDIIAQAPKCAGGQETPTSAEGPPPQNAGCEQRTEDEKKADADSLLNIRDVLAKDTYEAMEEHCIELMAKDDKYQKYCTDIDRAEGLCEMHDGTCIGSCTLVTEAELAAAVGAKCPNSCGIVNPEHPPEDGSGGDCVLDERGKNVCKCFDETVWGGPDCSIEVGGTIPALDTLVPKGCATQSAKGCPSDVFVKADLGVTNFVKSDDIKCRVDGQITDATFIDASSIRCALAPSSHRGSSVPEFHKVEVSNDGDIFSHSLHFCYHNSECTVCDVERGTHTVKEGTCAVDNMCVKHGETGTDQFSKCKVCDTSHSQTKWKFNYLHDECAPSFAMPPLRKATELVKVDHHFQVNEFDLNIPVNPGSQALTTRINPYTRDDDVNLPQYTITTPTEFFEINKDTGVITIVDVLDHETVPYHTLKVEVDQGGLTDEIEIIIAVLDSDESAIFSNPPYSAEVQENAEIGPLAIKLGDGSNGKILAVDADDASSANGQIKYGIENTGKAVANLPFKIDPATGVVSTTEPLDFEAPGLVQNADGTRSWRLSVTAASGGGSKSATHLTVTVGNVNEPATFIGLDSSSISEAATVGQRVATIQVEDPEIGDTHTVTISGEHADWFEIVGDKLVVAKDDIDFEAMDEHNLNLVFKAVDQGGEAFSMDQTVRIVDANDAPGKIFIKEAVHGNMSLAELPALTSFNEVHPVGVVLAVLYVEDQDIGQEHSFEIVEDPSSKFEIVDGNNLVLKDAVDFEAYERAGIAPEVSLTLVATDLVEFGTSLSSLPQSFTLGIQDGVDVPRDFVIIDAEPVQEMSAVGTVAGKLQAVDQDEQDPFTLAVEGDNFKVGKTTCEVVPGKGTVCSASLEVKAAIDFESNRAVSKDEATVVVEGVGVHTGGQRASCGLNCPSVSITNVNEAPTGVALAGTSDVTANADGSFSVIEGYTVFGHLVAIDIDDSCPAELEGCLDTNAAGTYKFALKDSSDNTFGLSQACGLSLSAAQRIGQPCQLVPGTGSTPMAGVTYPLIVAVTDQGGLTSDLRMDVKVTVATVSISLCKNVEDECEPLTSLEEDHRMTGMQIAGEVRLHGWVDSWGTIVEPRVTKGPFSLTNTGSSGRRSRRSTMGREWVLMIHSEALKHENENLEIELTMGATDAGFDGYVFKSTIRVTEYVPAKRQAVRICEDDDCDWARSMNADPSKYVELNAWAEPGTVISTFDVQDVASKMSVGATEFDIVREIPRYGLFEIMTTDDNLPQLVTVKKPKLHNNGNGTSKTSQVLIRSRTEDGVEGEFTIIVAIDYCPDVHPVCHSEGTRQCMDVRSKEKFMCSCHSDWRGDDCSINDVRFQQSSSKDDKDGLSGGIIAIIVILVVLCLVLVVAGVAFVRTRKTQEEKELAQIRMQENMAQLEQRARAGGAPPPFIPGVANHMYGWYDPDASKQAIYEELSGANPGDFKLRGGDLRKQEFELHIKTPQQLIMDEKVSKVAGGYKLTGPGRTDQPTFPLLPMLIDHYSAGEDANAPFTLNGSAENPIYFAVDESVQVYDNAAIKNRRNMGTSSAAAPALPSKSVQSRSEC